MRAFSGGQDDASQSGQAHDDEIVNDDLRAQSNYCEFLFIHFRLGLPCFDDAPTIMLGAATLVRFDAATFTSLTGARLGFLGAVTTRVDAASLTRASLVSPVTISGAHSGLEAAGSCAPVSRSGLRSL